MMRVRAALSRCPRPRGSHRRNRASVKALQGHGMLIPGPDIQPTDREFILTTLHAAFPKATVTIHPRPASIATLFRVHDGAVLRHQLFVPRCVLDDARVKRTRLAPLAPMMARAIAEMGQRGCDVVILGGESDGVV